MTRGGCSPLVLVILAAAPLFAQKPVDLLQKEEAHAAAQRQFQQAETALRAAYDALEKAVLSARAEQGVTWTAEMKRVLEGLSSAATTAASKKASRQQMAALFKRDAPTAARKVEIEPLRGLEAHLVGRLAALGDQADLTAQALTPDALAQAALADVLGNKPFHEIWNDACAPAHPAAQAYRAAFEAVDKARWDLDVAKDPVMQYRRGAPPGFARVPAGSYVAIGSSGFAASGPRRGRKAVTLARDVFVGLREVTNAEYFVWWSKLDVDLRRKHVPVDQGGQPQWTQAEGEDGPALPDDVAQLPVAGVTLASALQYAAHRGARLPTEAEWCAAAGGRDGRAYPWGESWQPGMCNDAEKKANALLPVGALPGAGPFGHQDLIGNVSEWVATYESGKDIDPAKLDDANVVIRGGSYARSKEEISNGWVWYGRALFDRQKDVGFRLAMDAPRK